MPELTTVVSEIRPRLSPKHEPPAIAAMLKTKFPFKIWVIHKKIGAQAAKVPHEVPVATDNTEETKKATRATVLAEMPMFRLKVIIEAPTPVDIKASAIA